MRSSQQNLIAERVFLARERVFLARERFSWPVNAFFLAIFIAGTSERKLPVSNMSNTGDRNSLRFCENCRQPTSVSTPAKLNQFRSN